MDMKQFSLGSSSLVRHGGCYFDSLLRVSFYKAAVILCVSPAAVLLEHACPAATVSQYLVPPVCIV